MTRADEPPDLSLDPAEIDRLLATITEVFAEPGAAGQLLEQVGAPDDLPPTSDGLAQLVRDARVERPYLRILAAALKIYRSHPILTALAQRHGLPGVDPDEGERTCHVLVPAGRPDAEVVLAEAGLAPQRIWVTPDLTSYAVAATDLAEVMHRLDDPGKLPVLVVGPGSPDYLIHRLTVTMPDGRRIPLDNVAVQQNLRSVAERVIGAYYRDADIEVALATADHVPRTGPTRRFAVSDERSLHELGIRDGSTLHLNFAVVDDALVVEAVADGRAPFALSLRASVQPWMRPDAHVPVTVMISRRLLGADDLPHDKTRLIELHDRSELAVEATGEGSVTVPERERSVNLPIPDAAQPVHTRVINARSAPEPGPARLRLALSQDNSPKEPLELDTVVRKGAPPPWEGNVLTVRECYDADGARVYQYYFRMEGLFQDFRSPPLRADDDRLLNGLDTLIRQFWAARGGDDRTYIRTLQEFGSDLLDRLVDREMQAFLWEYRAELTRQLKLCSNESRVPWELLNLRPPGTSQQTDEDNFLGRAGLLRWPDRLAADDPSCPEHLRSAPVRLTAHRALVVAPRYADLPDARLDHVEDECAALREIWDARVIAPDDHELVRILRSAGEFDLLHFAGHAQPNPLDAELAQLLLASGGPSVPFDERAVRSHLLCRVDGGWASRPIVVLNACAAQPLARSSCRLNGFAEAFLNRGAGAFVAPRWAVNDEPSATFALAFHQTLRDGHTATDAITAARRAARVGGDPTWMAYTGYAHPFATVEREEPGEVR